MFITRNLLKCNHISTVINIKDYRQVDTFKQVPNTYILED